MLTIQEVTEIKRTTPIFGQVDGATVQNLCNTLLSLHEQLMKLIKENDNQSIQSDG